MNLKRAFSAEFLLKGVFGLSLLLLLAISAISYKNTLEVRDATKLLVHSYNVRNELVQLLSHLKDAETGQRGFLITRDSIYLQPKLGASDRVSRSFETLRELTAANPYQQDNLDSLKILIDLRFSYLDSTILNSSSVQKNRFPFLISMVRGKKAMDSNRVQIDRMLKHEFEHFSECQKMYRSTISQSPTLNLLFLLFCLAVFTVSYININRNLHILKKSNKKLSIATESISHAEEIGQFSTWQWNLGDNTLHYSDNQYRLLGCEPQSFAPTVENFMEFVHPDDRHIIEEGSAQVFDESRASSSFFRIVRSDGTVRHFQSIGKLLSDAKGQKTLIGVNMDITDQHLNKVELEAKNRALQLSNKELDSFNHMASHDLQEPLRKIQTIISRIYETEAANLSETGKDYFEKIGSSATRMRALINDLLLFAGANKPEKVFERADLNELLENAKQELAQAIETQKAVVLSDRLPEMQAIPFQLQQLFINLISNSVKYSRPDIAPVIRIDSGPALADDYPELAFEKDKKYLKISFADNGTGFEQQYAEKIFDLFYRLRNTSVQVGTGLGLAICKRIVENHGGFITAKGVPGAGSTFTVFLPER